MKNAMETIISGIQCDNQTCDYHDDDVKHSDYGSWLNKPCPKCGDNLLTEVDMHALKVIIAATDAVNDMFIGVDLGGSDCTTITEIKMNGTGSIEIGVPFLAEE